MRLALAGCRPRPLASYLQALGVLRLVSEQGGDRQARGSWEDDVFVLDSHLDEDRLVSFFGREYRPSPILAPWNGGSGFYPKDRREAIERIRSSTSDRFAAYRRALAAADAALAAAEAAGRPADDRKLWLVRRLRATLPDEAVAWLDAVLVLAGERLEFPPLLGSGGNDGRLEFTNNFMQRLVELIDPVGGEPALGSERALRAALFDAAVPGLGGAPIGQFHPAAAGGANAGTGFSGSEPTNPWAYVLMLEGALLFAASATRRSEVASPGLSYPFTMRALTAGGSGGLSATDARNARGEMWLPLWSRPASYDEIGRVFGEGRLTVGARVARDGLDAARAIAGLGVDRGFSAFERVAFGQRNGLAYLATPQGRFAVPDAPRADLAADLDRDEWRKRLERLAAADEAAGSLAAGTRRLVDALFALARRGGPEAVQEVLIALGRLHRTIGASKGLRERLAPVRLLGAEWAAAADDGSPELEVALALATLGRHTFPLRWNLYPLVRDQRKRPTWDPESVETVAAASLDDLLLRIAARRAHWMRAEGAAATCLDGLSTVGLPTLARFVAGGVDASRVAELVYGLSLVTPSTAGRTGRPHRAAAALLPAGFALVKPFLVTASQAAADHAVPEPAPPPGERREPDLEVPLRAPWILSRLAARPVSQTWEEVTDRCRLWMARSLERRLELLLAPPPPAAARRWAAALALPISRTDGRRLVERFVVREAGATAHAHESDPASEGALA